MIDIHKIARSTGYVTNSQAGEIEDLILKELGSCAECIHYTCVGYTPKGEKKAPDMCRLTWSAQEADHFCKSFTPRTNQG